MPQIFHTPTVCGGYPFVATSDIVALQAASLVVVSVFCSMHEVVIVVVHLFGFNHDSRFWIQPHLTFRDFIANHKTQSWYYPPG